MPVKLFQTKSRDLDNVDEESSISAISMLEQRINIFLIRNKAESISGPHMHIYDENGVKKVIYTASVVYEERHP